ncbi:MAG TPA: 30S ribosome-binding factor RbfA [Alphaproteobacteria bacterium]
MKKQRKQPEGQRQLRVGEEIRHVISETLQRGGFNDPALINASLITITEVRPSPDLKHATVFAMPLGGRDLDAVLNALNENAYFFQKEIAHQMKIKFTPKLVFKADDTFEEAEKIDRIIRGIHDDEDTEQ